MRPRAHAWGPIYGSCFETGIPEQRFLVSEARTLVCAEICFNPEACGPSQHSRLCRSPALSALGKLPVQTSRVSPVCNGVRQQHGSAPSPARAGCPPHDTVAVTVINSCVHINNSPVNTPQSPVASGNCTPPLKSRRTAPFTKVGLQDLSPASHPSVLAAEISPPKASEDADGPLIFMPVCLGGSLSIGPCH
jgi:hypothetical protein